MLTVKTKLFLYYLLVLALITGWVVSFYLKYFILAWLVFFPLAIFSRYIFHPLPKAYKQIYNYLYAKIILIIFAIIAFSIATINILGCYMNSAILDKINNYSFSLLLILLIPVFVLTILKEIKAARAADNKIRSCEAKN